MRNNKLKNEQKRSCIVNICLYNLYHLAHIAVDCATRPFAVRHARGRRSYEFSEL